jgi:hypothetical protein
MWVTDSVVQELLDVIKSRVVFVVQDRRIPVTVDEHQLTEPPSLGDQYLKVQLAIFARRAKAAGNPFVCQFGLFAQAILLSSKPQKVAGKLSLARRCAAVVRFRIQVKSRNSTGGEVAFTAGVEFRPITRS